MNDYLKASALVLVGVILCMVLSGQNKYYPALIAIAVSAMIGVAAMQYIRPILDFFTELQANGIWDNSLLLILLKAVGIGILSEIVTMVCADSGNAAMGKSLQFLTMAVILWLSLPLFEGLLELVGELLGKL